MAGASSHADRLQTIRNTFDETGVLVDPHTADGIKVARQFVEPGVPMLVLETALPAKFAETIEAALGAPCRRRLTWPTSNRLPQRVTLMDCDAQAVRAFIEAHAKCKDALQAVCRATPAAARRPGVAFSWPSIQGRNRACATGTQRLQSHAF